MNFVYVDAEERQGRIPNAAAGRLLIIVLILTNASEPLIIRRCYVQLGVAKEQVVMTRPTTGYAASASTKTMFVVLSASHGFHPGPGIRTLSQAMKARQLHQPRRLLGKRSTQGHLSHPGRLAFQCRPS